MARIWRSARMTGRRLAVVLCGATLLWAWRGAGQEPGQLELPPAEEPEAPALPAPAATNLAAGMAGTNVADSPYPHLEVLAEAIVQVKKHYVEEKTYKEIVYGALHGMLQSLDPHSSFLEADEYSELQDDTAGRFSGVGIHIGVKNGVLTVIAPIEDTPAYRAGIQSGDVILEIDDRKTFGLSLRDAVKQMRGAKGSKVTLTIQRQDSERSQTVEIIRDDIKVPSVKGARLIGDGIGYVRITEFTAPTAALLQTALTNLLAQKMDALVLDLRNNPGGLLQAAVDVSQKFLKTGDLIVTTRGRNEGQEEVRHAGGAGHYLGFPMAVLVNGGSASASEIVAGALQDNRRAILVGDTTFGKGSVQSLLPLSNDRRSALRLTVARYYTPGGRMIHDKGIDPDIPVYVPPEEWRKVQAQRTQAENPALFTEAEKTRYADVVDRQLQRAVDVLQGLKIFK